MWHKVLELFHNNLPSENNANCLSSRISRSTNISLNIPKLHYLIRYLIICRCMSVCLSTAMEASPLVPPKSDTKLQECNLYHPAWCPCNNKNGTNKSWLEIILERLQKLNSLKLENTEDDYLNVVFLPTYSASENLNSLSRQLDYADWMCTYTHLYLIFPLFAIHFSVLAQRTVCTAAV